MKSYIWNIFQNNSESRESGKNEKGYRWNIIGHELICLNQAWGQGAHYITLSTFNV